MHMCHTRVFYYTKTKISRHKETLFRVVLILHPSNKINVKKKKHKINKGKNDNDNTSTLTNYNVGWQRRHDQDALYSAVTLH